MATPSRLSRQPERPDTSAEALAALADGPPLNNNKLPNKHELLLSKLQHGRTLHSSFDALHSSLKSARSEGAHLTDAGASVVTRLTGGHAATDVLLSQTRRLRHELATTERRQALVAAFGRAYALSEDDEALLNAPAGTADDLPQLLKAMDHVAEVRQRAAALSAQHPLALQLTVGMAAHEERGYGRLFRWLDQQCKSLPVRPTSTQLQPLGRAVDVLRRRPALLSSCLEEIATCRQQPLLNAFVAALSGSGGGIGDDPEGIGGEGGMLPPLDAALYELRSCLDGEIALFGRILGDEGATASSSPLSLELRAAIASATSILAAPLSRHVSRLLSPPPSPSFRGLTSQLAARHRLLASLQHHAVKLAPILGTSPTVVAAAVDVTDAEKSAATAAAEESTADSTPPLTMAVHTCLSNASTDYEMVREGLITKLSSMASAPNQQQAAQSGGGLQGLTSSSTAPGEAVIEGAHALDVLLEAHETLLIATAATEEEEEEGDDEGVASGTDARAEAIVSKIVAVVLSRCADAKTAGGVGGLSDMERLIWLLNSVEALRGTLAARIDEEPVEAADATTLAQKRVSRVISPSLKRLTTEVNGLLDDLARAAAQDVLTQCGLSTKLAALQTAEAQSSVKMAEIVGLEPLALASVMRGFYGVLFRRGDALLPSAERIFAPDVRKRASNQTARTVASTYQHIHSLVSRSGSGYENPETILLHSPREVEALLGLM